MTETETPTAATRADMAPPDGAYVKQRWIPQRTVDWVKQCDQILITYGAVRGTATYRTRAGARHHARRLKRLMTELRIHEAWQLKEHTEHMDGGWAWSIEYLGRSE